MTRRLFSSIKNCMNKVLRIQQKQYFYIDAFHFEM